MGHTLKRIPPRGKTLVIPDEVGVLAMLVKHPSRQRRASDRSCAVQEFAQLDFMSRVSHVLPHVD
jgi:hypothetical protein